jgi:hypothetical protein
MDRILKSNFIIISGSGKKVGKTYLAVALIRHFSVQSPIIALKISPHRHDRLGNVLIISDKDGYRLFRELEVHDKNSGQFLAAGAQASFFLETEDGSLRTAIEEFSMKCNPLNLPVVCESGALGTIIKPGVMIYIASHENPPAPFKQSTRKSADIVLPAGQFSSSEAIKSIELSGNNWIVK